MKSLNLNITNLLVIMMLLFSFKGISQTTQANANDTMETFNASGDDATGSSGSVTYSIGQVFYTYIGESVYDVAQGIQQEELSQTLDTPENSVEPKAEIVIFPNPTTDFVTVNMEGIEFKSGLQSYQLYDLQGRLLKQNTIDQADTRIDLNDLSSSIYILQVYVDNKILKTFKILKK
ncbi:T9SS type A sorting domain-containing protein [Flavobacterium franklandianum]|uniref:T9SS type A sorting domain-containing protein n=1 Tax=Flavobacterium franklandianum TaxID=2594430 RepID=A0A553CRA5_9FLAO|nr:T9SS type A sorting domain-containing protein [Flavobacterium franklandianum]TRX22991.1 T9SS type A sorting domain-containing protein [Flavobacterium franklandianum]TRX27557.1 T9SS type A sorting domain-containing protein [Flavobacterium franklandianum]